MSADLNFDSLAADAIRAKDLAIAPYSNFKVGAALLTASGEVITAGNIESSTYGLTLCAERVALFSALSDGHRSFDALAIATNNGSTPCGACRQILWEFAGDIQILLVDGNSQIKRMSLTELFPLPFDESNLATQK